MFPLNSVSKKHCGQMQEDNMLFNALDDIGDSYQLIGRSSYQIPLFQPSAHTNIQVKIVQQKKIVSKVITVQIRQ